MNDPSVVFIGIAIPGETPAQIEDFRANYGVTMPVWIDNNYNYRKLVGPTGRQFPIDVVIDSSGVVQYLENDYYPGEAVGVVKKVK